MEEDPLITSFMADDRLVSLAEQTLEQPRPHLTRKLLQKLLNEASRSAELVAAWEGTTDPHQIVRGLFDYVTVDEPTAYYDVVDKHSQPIEPDRLANNQARLEVRRANLSATVALFESMVSEQSS